LETQPVPRDVVACMIESNAVGTASWTVDFWVDDADAAAGRATQLGGALIIPPYDTPIFRQAVLADREGAIFSISQLRMNWS
jgi:predicted enzyme related to lactoylglutathione lyase